MHSAVSGVAPSCIKDMLTSVADMPGRERLRSAASGSFDVPRVQGRRHGSKVGGGSKSISRGVVDEVPWIRGGVVDGVFRPDFEGGVVDEVPWIRGGVVDGVFRPDFEGGGSRWGSVNSWIRRGGSWWSFPARFRESWQVFWGDPIPKVCYKILGGPIPKVGGVRGQSGTGLQVCFATLLQNFGGVQC